MEKLFPLLGISKATHHRRKASGKLDAGESDRVVRFARLMGKAIVVMESEGDRATMAKLAAGWPGWRCPAGICRD